MSLYTWLFGRKPEPAQPKVAPPGLVTINVTRKHIDKGRPFQPKRCPLALAFKEAGFEVSVSPGFVTFFDRSPVDLPLEAEKFRQRFDSGDEVKPFSFEIEVPA